MDGWIDMEGGLDGFGGLGFSRMERLKRWGISIKVLLRQPPTFRNRLTKISHFFFKTTLKTLILNCIIEKTTMIPSIDFVFLILDHCYR